MIRLRNRAGEIATHRSVVGLAFDQSTKFEFAAPRQKGGNCLPSDVLRLVRDDWVRQFVWTVRFMSLSEEMLTMPQPTSANFDGFGLDPGEAKSSGKELRSFLDLLASVYFFDGADRRTEPRMRITLPVVIERLDENGERLEYPIRGVTRDLSHSGIGFVCQDPVGTKHVAFQLSSPCGVSIEVIAEVLRCEPIGYYYNVGCKFVSAQQVGFNA